MSVIRRRNLVLEEQKNKFFIMLLQRAKLMRQEQLHQKTNVSPQEEQKQNLYCSLLNFHEIISFIFLLETKENSMFIKLI